jgi:cytochrome c oxidase subunit 5b
MLNLTARALRHATLATRSATRPSFVNAMRSFNTTPRLSSGAPPKIFGSGSKEGEVPTDQLQATGLERFQLLGELEGVSAFDVAPLDSSRVGTKENPITVPSLVSSLDFQGIMVFYF